MRRKISLIGAGNIGSTMAYIIANKGLADVVLLDLDNQMPKGKCLDIAQSAWFTRSGINLLGTSNYEDIQDSNVIIITAGITRKEDSAGNWDRESLLPDNAKIIKNIAKNIKMYSPNAFVICITNPLDIIVSILQETSGLPKTHVVGMAGELDSSRFAYFLSKTLNASYADINAYVIGAHNDTMVPLPQYSNVFGMNIPQLINTGMLTQEQVEHIIHKVQHGGNEIVELLSSGSAFYAPASAAVSIAESYFTDQNKLFIASSWVDSYYDAHSMYIGLPVIINNKGVTKTIKFELDQHTQDRFNHSVHSIRSVIDNNKHLFEN